MVLELSLSRLYVPILWCMWVSSRKAHVLVARLSLVCTVVGTMELVLIWCDGLIKVLNGVCIEWAKRVSAFWLGRDTGGGLPAAQAGVGGRTPTLQARAPVCLEV